MARCPPMRIDGDDDGDMPARKVKQSKGSQLRSGNAPELMAMRDRIEKTARSHPLGKLSSIENETTDVCHGRQHDGRIEADRIDETVLERHMRLGNDGGSAEGKEEEDAPACAFEMKIADQPSPCERTLVLALVEPFGERKEDAGRAAGETEGDILKSELRLAVKTCSIDRSLRRPRVSAKAHHNRPW